jgi:hypothetical protein
MLRGKGVGGWKSKASDRDIWRSIIGGSRLESHSRTKGGGGGGGVGGGGGGKGGREEGGGGGGEAERRNHFCQDNAYKEPKESKFSILAVI